MAEPPTPCIRCNRFMKHDKLYQRAEELSCSYIVTGHYARIEKDESSGRYLLKKAKTRKRTKAMYSIS